MARSTDESTERLEGWKGVVTGADADVLPPDQAPKGQNAVITHAALESGVVRRRKGATPDGYVDDSPSVLGLFDFPSELFGKLLLIVTADGGLNTVRVAYELTWAEPPSLGYGTPLGALQLNAAATIDGTYTYTPDFGVLLDVGNYELHVTFTPDNLALYAIKTLVQNLVVTAGTPVITWANPANITYGDEITGTELNATAPIPGTFVYTPDAHEVLAAGTHTLRVDFTPTDLTTWLPTFKEVTIVVDKATPVITWIDPASIYYGTALSGTQLGATADVAGTFTYTPPSGTVLSAGAAQNLHVDFVPTDTANYTNADDDAAITVQKAWPEVVWNNPADITYGTLLSGTQLNGTADVPGTFVYDPPAGTLLSAGAGQSLTAQFTPTDTANYEVVDVYKAINVDKATPVITWSNPADIAVGTALDATQLNATADVAGSFLYSPLAGVVLGVGDAQALATTFTPTDGDNYTVAYATVYINVTGVVYGESFWLDGQISPLISGSLFTDKWLDGQIGPGTE